MTQEELKYAIENGIINPSQISDAVNAMKREEIIKKHPFKIWQGNDGRWYSYLLIDGKKTKIAKKNKESLLNDIIRQTEADNDNPTLRQLYYEWNDRRLQMGIITDGSYLRMQQTFNRHFDEEMRSKRIRSMSQSKFVSFLEDELIKYDLTSKGFSSLKAIVKGILKRARRCGYIDYTADDVIKDLDTTSHKFRRKHVDQSKEVYYDDEIEDILKYLVFNQDNYNLCLLTLFLTGMRVGEAVALKQDAIDVDRGCIIVKRTESKRRVGKSKKVEYYVQEFTKTDAGMRNVVVPEQYKWVLKKLYDMGAGQEYIFMRKDGGLRYRVLSEGVRRRLKKICKMYNITYRSPHKIRKTYDSILLDNGVDQRFILDQMGHVDMAMNEERYHRNRRHMDERSKMLGELKEFQINVV